MREIVAKVTSNGRLTLPAAVRHQLGIEPGDRVTIVLTDEHAELRRSERTVMSVFGLIPSPPGLVTDDFDDFIDEAVSAHAATVAQHMREGRE